MEIDRAARLSHSDLTWKREILRLFHRNKFDAFEELAAFDFKPAEIRISEGSRAQLNIAA